MSRRRGGFSLPEAIVALLLGLFLVQLGLTTVAGLRSSHARMVQRTDALMTVRAARRVLRAELRRGEPGRDWVADADSVALRAFRGTAAVCPTDSVTVELAVAYRGERAPDPSKDSVLLLRSDGSSVAVALAGVSTSGSCPGAATAPTGWQRFTWRLDRPVPPGFELARLFERGSYHVAERALRYRRGMSGRQPLTPESLAGTSTLRSSDTGLSVLLVPRDSAAGAPWTGFLAWDEPR